LGLEPVEPTRPRIEISRHRAARSAAAAEHGGAAVSCTLRRRLLSIESPIAPRSRATSRRFCEGSLLLLDPISASRADGITIDVADTPNGQAFRVDNPNSPRVRSMSVRELKALLDSGKRFELLDVRTPEERAIAAIPGAALLNESEAARIESLPRDTMLVLHCHHGGRSQQAAEQFVSLGFSQVWNVVGGIDAWSQEVDPEVPRY
jgi:monothiol glutaredoxin